jgi:hypothetical protein
MLVYVADVVARPDTHRDASARAARVCRAPRLTGLVLAVARERAAKASCRLRLAGAPVKRPTIQTIRRQNPGAGQHGRAVTVWVNPLCGGSALRGPPQGEPLLTPGPTELVSGLYLDGGPYRLISAPRCASLAGTPEAGTITVTNPQTAAIVATETVADGQLATIPLPPGTYTISGTFANASSDGQPIQSRPQAVTILSGKTVREDVSVSVP